MDSYSEYAHSIIIELVKLQCTL